jgi:asparagine synthase (glutamine-hydrolysing)
LAILDRSDAGSQPFDSHGYVVVFNGEIYNFLELRETLRQKGFSFVTETDTEVLTASLRAWGKDALLKFNGMWAFAAWDKATGELFVARDRFGVKPLFYTTVEGGYAFASEMKALFPFLPRVERSRHFGWCLENLYEYESTENCLIEGVYRFPAGHFATVGNGTMTPSRYWHAYEHLEKTVPKTYDEQVGQFRELFLDACRIRMRSDVRLGTSLSGGVDSRPWFVPLRTSIEDTPTKRESATTGKTPLSRDFPKPSSTKRLTRKAWPATSAFPFKRCRLPRQALTPFSKSSGFLKRFIPRHRRR